MNCHRKERKKIEKRSKKERKKIEKRSDVSDIVWEEQLSAEFAPERSRSFLL